MTTIHIDESGTIGMRERYFVIAALITDDALSEKRIERIVTRAKARFINSELFIELKGSKMSKAQKERFLTKVHEIDGYKIAFLIADKRHIQPRLYANKNLCFNFLFATLAKEILSKVTDDVKFCVDNRTVKVSSVNSLADYVKVQAITTWGFDHDIEINLRDSKSCNLLQAVDIVANTLFAKYNYGHEELYDINKDKLLTHELFPRRKFGS